MTIQPRRVIAFCGATLLIFLLPGIHGLNDTAINAQTAASPFQEQSGQVVMEAENFHTTISRSGKSWTSQTTPTGFAGSAAMKSLPDSGTSINSGYATTSPELQYQVQFATAGTYHVWIRAFSAKNGNTLHVGLDGQPAATADRIELKTQNAWAWTKGTMDGPVATVSVPSAGLHTINVWMREDGFSVDRLLLTTSSTFTPSGIGPAESPRSSGGGTTNQPPVVNAGADQTITLPSSATLTGSAKDDGLPNPPGTLTYSWSKAGGPGTVTFGAATSPGTSASFSSAGTYTLRLTVSDSAATGSDDVVVTVTEPQTNPLPPGSPFQEQSGQVVMEAENFHTNINRGGKSWNAQATPAGFVGASAMHSSPNSGTILDTGYATTSPEMQFQVQFATAGTYHVWIRGYAITTNDNSIHFGVNGQPVTSADRVELLSPLNTWAWSRTTMDGPVATLSIASAGLHTINLWMREDGFLVDRLLLTTNSTFTPSGNGPAESPRSSGGGTTNQPPVVNAGADQTITLPGSATLTGSANDDGLPNPPGTLTYAWTKVSGPGTVTFGSASSPNTTASFSVAGGYTLRLTVSDSAATATDDVVVTVLSSTSTASPFQEQSGQVVMEAENFHTNVSRGGKSWTAQAAPAGFVGVGAMQSLPNGGSILDTGYATTSPEMQFQVQFATSGTYHVWIRGFATTTNDNSVHFGVNGQTFTSADRVELLSPLNSWAWSKATMDGPVATLSIPSAGLHTINLWMREDGFYVDRLLLTTSSTFTPSGSGPAESPRSGTTGPTAPAAPSGLTATGGTSAIALAWNASTGATGYNVYRSTTSTVSTSGTPLNGSTPLTTTSYSDTAVSAGITYHYVVTGVNSAGSSPPSTSASAQLTSSSSVTCAASTNPTLLNFSSTVSGTFAGSGFNCFMPGTAQPTGGGLTLNASSSHLAIASTDGDLFQNTNTQDNALALKFANSGAYAVRARIKGPFSTTTAYQGAGVFLALNADNYAKFTIGHGDAGPRFEFAMETAATFASGAPDAAFTPANVDQASEAIDLWLVRNSNGTIQALYRLVTNLTGSPTLGPIVSMGVTSTAPSWAVSSAELYGGVLTTDFGTGGSFNTLFDEFHLSAPPSTSTPPSSGWANEMSLPVAVQEVSVVAANNKVYVAGGETETGRVQTLYVFDPASPSWVSLAPYPGTARDHIGIAATGGFIYLIGGITAWPQPSVATVHKYDLAANTWSTAASLPSPRGAMGVAVINGKIYAAGGLREGLAVTDFTVYDPATNTWQTLPSMPTARDHLVGVALDGKFYAIGGRPGGNSICSPVTTVEMYDPVTNSWSTKSPMTVARGGHAAGTLNGKIQVFGGEGGESNCANIASSEEYDAAANTWSPLTSMPIPRHGTGGATIGTKVYLPGGATAAGHQPTAAHQSFTQAGSQEPPPTSPPAAPTGLTATGGTSAIALAWNASSGATGYNVYRSTTTTVSTSGTPLNGSTPLTTTSYSDTAVSAGITYHYVVTAVNSAGTSPPSASASAQLSSSSTVTCTTSSNPSLLNFSAGVAGTYGGSGFNCFMPGTAQPTGGGLTLNASSSHLAIASTDGDLFQNTNTQDNALALKLSNSGTYAVRARIKGPFSTTTAYQGAGVFLALNADNYAKFTIGHGDAGPRFEFAVETGATFASGAPDAAFTPANVDQASEAIDLWLVRNSNGTIQALYRLVTNLTGSPALGPIVSMGVTSTAPSWAVSSAELYGGVLTTDFGTGGSFNTFFDEFQLSGAPASEPPPGSPPAAPTGVTAAGGTSAITVTWSAATGATGYNVYRNTTTPVSTTGTPLNGTTPLTTTSYSDTAVSAGVTYHYVVTALNSFGSSPPSATVSAQLGSSSTITCATSSNPTLLNFSTTVAATYGGSGFNCFMPGTVQPSGTGLVLNPSSSHLAVTSTDGDLFQAVNNQNNALALKVANSGTYSVRARIKGPFNATTAFQSAGVFLALNADNYAKLTVGHGNAGPRLEFAVETAAAFAQGSADVAFTLTNLDQSSEALDLWLVRSSDGTLQALYRQVTNLTSTPVLGPIVSMGVTSTAPSWAVSNAELYGGVLTTDFGSGGAFDTFFDEFQLSGAPTSEPPPNSPPAAPTGLTAAGGTSAITLAWNASTGATGYHVYRSTTATVSTSGTPLNGSTPLTTTSYSDTAVSAGVTYHYVVTALNSFGSSPPSASASAQLGSSSTITCATSSNPTLLNFSGSVAATYGSSGFNCFMPGTVQPTGAGLVLSGFNSHLVVTSTDGDIFQSINNQNNALALKLTNSASYSVRVRIKGPFSATTAFQSAGVFLALNADNYAKLAIGQGPGGLRLEFAVETGGSFAPAAAEVSFGPTNLDQSSEALDLWLVRKSDGTIEALYRQITDLTNSPVLGPIVSIGATPSAPSWSGSSTELYGGLLTTDTGGGGSMDTFFDEFHLGGPVSQSSTPPTPTSFAKKIIVKSGSTSGTAFGVNGFDNPTSLELGPDGKLYVATQSGKIYILTLDHQQLPTASGISVTHVQTLNEIFNRTTLTCNIGGVPSNCQFVSGTPTGRLVAGLAIGPESTPQQIVLYVTHSDPRIGENNSSTAMAIDTWSGTITRLYLQPGSGGNYVVASQQDLVVGLPRSRENHGPNGISFGPDGWMYFAVGGNTNFGKPSTFFSMLPEYYLAAAALRLNVTGLGTALPLNVKGVSSASGMTQFAGKLELFATGFRNAYDLVWHSNGSLYLNDNAGNAGLGGTPDSADGCSTPSINPGSLPDTLEKVTQGSYGGHPNPVRNECVLESGSLYSPPLLPDPQYAAHLLAYNQGASTNGIVEYTANAFGGALKGNLISATYAGNQNVRRVVLNSSGSGVIQEVNLGTFSQPLDVTTDGVGVIYVAEHGADQITVLIPEQTGTTCPNSATTDDDGDGFTDSDETAHGTDPCSGASFPPDLDGDFVGNLNDPDLDGDGIANTSDQLNFDPQNGAATALPVMLEWNPGNAPLGGIANTGFMGAQIASSGPRIATSAIHVGAAGGFMSLDTSSGSPDGPLNSQVNALQIGFNSTAAFTIHGRIVEPFNTVAPAPGHLAGIFFGPNQSNFLRLGLVGDTNGQKAVQLAFEQGGVFSEAARASLPAGAILMIDLHLIANPNTQVISAYYELNQSGSLELVGELAVPAAWFTNNQGAAGGTSLAGVVTSHGSATPITFVYDFFRIQPAPAQAAEENLLADAEQVHAGPIDLAVREEDLRIDGR